MKRPVVTVFLVVACFGMGIGATLWLSATVLRLDREQKAYEELAALEERVRLALWRIDSALGPFIGEESKRPFEYYQSFYPLGEAYDISNNSLSGSVLAPSPLMTFESTYIKLHFQLGSEGEIGSPQVPPDAQQALAEKNYLTAEAAKRARKRLEVVQGHLDYDRVLALLHEEIVDSMGRNMPTVVLAGVGEGVTRQAESNRIEMNARANQYGIQNNQDPITIRMKGGAKGEAGIVSRPPIPEATDPNSVFSGVLDWPYQSVNFGLKFSDRGVSGGGGMQPLWIGDELYLVRVVRVNGQILLQGCWLQWPTVRQWLLGLCTDLLPEAQLLPTDPGDLHDPTMPGRQLAALPVRLEAGALPPMDLGKRNARLYTYLGLAIGGIVLATLSMALLLWGAVSLSERRGRFVSAVTHELRTPLTTFRMYTEMLASGMVNDEDKRQHYLETLHGESRRLAHLVENVLAYARLERGSPTSRLELLSAAALLGRIEETLIQRVQQADMILVTDSKTTDAQLRADPGAVEQIIFNLVDNACKYARSASDRRIHVNLTCDGRHVFFHVVDYGPGVLSKERRRIFQPFKKSVQEAAQSAPGVGLGLGLSRRLARAMGGTLYLEESTVAGACFVLRMPRSGTRTAPAEKKT